MEKQAKTLKELQASILEIDNRRRSEDLTNAEREVLELTAVALRDAERIAIATLQKQLIKDMEAQTAALNARAKVIRAKVTQMNKTPKVLNSIELVIKIAVKIVAAVAKW
ncbi:MAG: hypothetical protein LBE79_08425 [Tannerella sp.]|jgi:replicative DNA helicase|nr:hypothetical protein [Tannerella sp.]